MEQYISQEFPDGASVEAALLRAKSGGAIDTALQNKAPAGYGLGLETPEITVESADDAVANGWYRCPDPFNSGSVGWLFVVSYGTTYKFQYFYNIKSVYEVFVGRRFMYSGTWYPWEYINPPMLLGKEYRTTERYLGKPVYAKLIDFGAIPNTTTKWVSFSDDTNARAIRASAVFNDHNVIPGMTANENEYMMEVGTLSQSVGIKTYRDWGNYQVKATVHYWKTTD